MENELNTLTFNNADITFSESVDNTATSDELTATPLYQDKMGTAYSKSKVVTRVLNLTGISLILTAAAIKTGSVLANAYVLNPPSISETKYTVEGSVFEASFKVSNSAQYEMTYYLYINDIEMMVGDCSIEKEYVVTYSELKGKDQCHFYIEFTNGVDYKKTVESYTFIVEE